MRFRNPANGYVEEVSAPGLWVFLWAPIYFAVKGVWGHAAVSVLLFPLIIPWLIYPFFARNIMRTHYLRKGWEEV